jgi:hypothetical protein
MLLDTLENERSRRTLEHMINVMKADAGKRNRAVEADNVRLAIQNDNRELRRIEAQLKDELERAASADALVSRIRMIKGAIDPSLLAKEAAALFRDTDFSDVRDNDTLMSRIYELKGQRGNLTLSLQKEFDVKLNKRNELTIELHHQLKAIGIPDELVRDLRLNGL